MTFFVSIITLIVLFIVGTVIVNLPYDGLMQFKKRKAKPDDCGLDFQANPRVKSYFVDDSEPFYLVLLSSVMNLNDFAEVSKKIAELKEQEYEIDYYYDQVVTLLKIIEPERLRYIIDVLQKCLDSYSKNREETVVAIDGLSIAKISQNREVWSKKIDSILVDNKRILEAVKNFCVLVETFLTRIYGDKMAAHVTDFSGVEELEKLTEVLEIVISKENGKEYLNTGIEARIGDY